MDIQIEKHRIKRRGSLLLIFGFLAAGATGFAEEAEALTPSALEKKSELIFEAKQSLSQESASWAEQKVLFERLIEIREKEIAEIDKFTESARERIDEVTRKRSELESEEKERAAWRKDFEKKVEALEEALTEVIALLPPPVKKEAGVAITRFKENVPDDQVSLQERFRTVLTILSAARDFDSKLSIDSEVREFDGKRYQLSVLYLGLDQAWFVDESGEIAGMGQPTPSGWVWTEERRLASRIRAAIDINQRELPPSMVSLPFSEKAVPAAENN